MPFIFNQNYFGLTIFFFLVETIIALFIDDRVIRPFFGDVLVVVLLYCFVRIFVRTEYAKAAFGVLIFACLIEILQYFDYVRLLGLQDNRVLATMMGRTFAWTDFAAYLTGFGLVIVGEKLWRKPGP